MNVISFKSVNEGLGSFVSTYCNITSFSLGQVNADVKMNVAVRSLLEAYLRIMLTESPFLGVLTFDTKFNYVPNNFKTLLFSDTCKSSFYFFRKKALDILNFGL